MKALGLAIVCAALHAPGLQAQTASAGDGRVDVAVGLAWNAAIGFSGPDALETTGAGDPYRLFAADSKLTAMVGYDVRMAVRVSRWAHLETGVTSGTPSLNVRVSSDIEGAPVATLSEGVRQIQIEGAFVADLGRARLGPRTMPFLTAGAAYLRELHEGQTLAANGWTSFGGGGVKHLIWSRPASHMKGIGVRIDARIVRRVSGAGFDDRAHWLPMLGGSVFVRL